MYKIADTNPSNVALQQSRQEGLRLGNGNFYGGWKTALASMIGLMLGPSSLLVFCFGTFIIPLEREFNWGIGAISLGGTVLTVMIIVNSLMAGYLSDRVGARQLILGSIPLFGLGVMGLSLINSSLWTFYGALAVVSLLGVSLWPVTYNRVTAGWFDRNLGLSMGIVNAGIGLGAALLPVVAGLITAAYGWRTAFLVLGGTSILVTWPVAFWLLKDASVEAGSRGGKVAASNVEVSLGESWNDRQLWLVLFGFFILGAASSGVVVHQVRILMDTGMSMAQAAAMQSVLGIAMIFGRISTGWLLDRVHVSKIMAGMCLAAALALLLLALGAPWGTAPLCAALVGLVIGAEFDVLGYLIPRYFGRLAFGSFYALVYSVFQVAAALAIGLLGWSRNLQGNYAIGLFIIASMLLVGAQVFFFMGTYRNPPGHQVEPTAAGNTQ
ncbi:MFS transporter [Pseudomonas sp. NPDC087342]|uniref:MFS transporter n=1 Tax=Pseudomonas sp. NPDC087342 TaxID=3364437 RepID=UPI00381B5473